MRNNSKSPPPPYSIGEVARKSGVKATTIRFYEQTGLLKPPPRSSGNRREYDAASLERLRFIRHARDLGFDTADIRELLELADQPTSPCNQADAIAIRHLQHVQKRIAQLQALQRELSHMLEPHKHGRIRQCQVIRALADHDECLHEHHQRIPHIDIRTPDSGTGKPQSNEHRH